MGGGNKTCNKANPIHKQSMNEQGILWSRRYSTKPHKLYATDSFPIGIFKVHWVCVLEEYKVLFGAQSNKHLFYKHKS